MIIALDTETYKKEEDGYYHPILDTREFKLGTIIIDKEKPKTFYNRKEMYNYIKQRIEYAERNKKKVYIYAHKMQFDWYAIARGELLNEEVKYVINQPFLAIYGKSYLCDTMSFYKGTVEEIGEALEIPKIKRPEKVKEIKELEEYNKRDTEIVMKMITNLRKTLATIGFKPRKVLTAGQLAMNSFLTFSKRNNEIWSFGELTENKENKKKYVQVIKSKHTRQIREAYRGGRTEAFKKGKYTNCTIIDINGLYAKIMHDMEFPNLRSEIYNEKPTNEQAKKYIEKEIGTIKCTMKTPPNTIKSILPYLPIRYKEHEIFPRNATMKGTWTIEEIKEALKIGYELIEVEWITRYTKLKENPLRTYIDFIYSIEKNEQNKIRRNCIKLLRNNLYGKFAQLRQMKDYKIIHRKDSEEYTEQGWEIEGTIDENYVITKKGDIYEANYTNPEISLRITALARNYLYKELIKIEEKDRLYCDTDSIIIRNFEKYKHLFKIGTELGEFKIVNENAEVLILGEKKYVVNDEVRISGLAKQKATKEDMQEQNSVKVRKMIGIKDAIRIGNIDLAGSFTEITERIDNKSKMDIITPGTITDEYKEKIIWED